jgi:hypothetical protein
MPGVVNTTDTFLANQVITSTVMNNIIDQTLFTSDAIASGNSTLALVAGKLKVGTITSNEMGVDAVTANAIAADAVTTAKILDANVTTAKILDANVTPAKLSQPLTLETAKATTSGTSVEFTGIPSWVKRITVILNGVSTNGSNNVELQIGSGSYSTSGYDTFCSYVGGSAFSASAFGGGFGIIMGGGTSALCYGRYTLDLIGGNKYIGSGVFHLHQVGIAQFTLQSAGASPVLSGPMDRIRITVIGGSNTFDAGSINIMYE